MLTRSTQVGEFYVMQPPQINPGKDRTMFTADMLIYDEESDRHVRIEWEDAMNACCVGDGTNGTVAGAAVLTGKTANNTLADWKAAAEDIARFNKGVIKTARADGTTAIGDDSAKEHAALKKDCRIMVVRPFIEHLMHSAILAVSGRDTGATLFGPADMQLSANTQVKTIEGAPSLSCLFFLPTQCSLSLSLRHRPLHGSLQGRDHQAAERAGHARHCLRWLRGRLQHAVVCQEGGRLLA